MLRFSGFLRNCSVLNFYTQSKNRITNLNISAFCTSATKVLNSQSHEKSTEYILKWISENGGMFLDRIGLMPNGIFAATKIRAGSNVFAVPSELAFIRENLTGEFKSKLNCELARHLPWPNESRRHEIYPFFCYPEAKEEFYEKRLIRIRERAIVALCLMYENSIGPKSDWAPWLSLLPLPPSQTAEPTFIGGPTLPYHYLEVLKGTQAFRQIINMKIDFDGVWIWVNNILKKLPAKITSKRFKREDFDHFMMIAGQQYFMNPPLIDFAQHAMTNKMCNVAKIIFNTITSDGEKEMVSFHAIRDIEAGEEIFHETELSSSETFARYGFSKPISERDSFQIPVKLEKQLSEEDINQMIKENNNTKAVTCRKIDFDDKLEEAYKEGKTWRWFAEKCDHNSVEMSPMGDNLSVEIQCEYPPKELIGICADVDERKISKIANKKDDQLDPSSEIGRKNKKERYVIDQIKIKEDKVFSAALNLIEERLVSLQHVQIAKDETELFQMFTKLEEHFRKEFGHVFKEAHSDVKNSKTKLPISNNESKFGISDNPKKLPICNNAKNAKKMGRKNVSSLPKTKDFVTLYSSPGDEVVDLVRRDILYLRYTEKVLFEWIANHLKAKSVQISQQMLEAAPADTPRSYAMLGALQKLAPSQIWIEQAQRWMPLPVRSAFGYFSEQEVKKMRESLRMQDSWRTEAARGTNEENIFSEMDEAHREDFIKKMGGSNKSDVQKEIEKFD